MTIAFRARVRAQISMGLCQAKVNQQQKSVTHMADSKGA
jgi:hypothetical protein